MLSFIYTNELMLGLSVFIGDIINMNDVVGPRL